MNPFIDAFIHRHQLLKKGDRLLVAVSGGTDSMVLLDWLMANSQKYQFTLDAMHVHHGLRGADADADERFVRQYCETYGVSYHCAFLRLDKKNNRRSLQDLAREKRYEALGEKMREIGANKLAVAHHGDDQAETMLMQWVRGAASSGSGMPAIRAFAEGELIRPFLSVSKKEIESIGREKEIPYRHDASNDSRNYTRNRLRKNVMPYLYAENPRLHQTAQRQAEQAQLEDAYLAEQAYSCFQTLRVDKQAVFCDDLLNIPHALQRRVIHLLLNYLDDENTSVWSRHDIDSVLELTKHSVPSASRNLTHSWKAERRYGELHFMRVRESGRSAAKETEVSLEFTEVYRTDRGLLRVYPPGAEAPNDNGRSDSVSINVQEAALPLCLRTRKPGDRIRLPDGRGSKKIKDVMIDLKIPKSIRDQWPILTDDHGTILWVPLLIRSYELQNQRPDEKNSAVLTYNEASHHQQC
ncbi:tRNA lysidine(34) synthetase TilS [Salisediminibacterium halotolerans]|uniref:tRNA(Ile)-lysidine synthase n=1 Tax=Salisediminibacterium halotolerans TaxID=517425 RepID=A0A1H9VSB4_9BACI|nr:tRNA lysidine(34) synthetase TilS [Salisediminibacterium haloalkalitolerans]SES24555.1 tRNA(Ile)-lysidine synthase/bifunctional protein TilS/HprT [Salisediminibacterium haloalkalitolerans]